MKTITIVVPTFNEEDNIPDVYKAVRELFDGPLSGYRYQLQFIDNCSTDRSRTMIRQLCDQDRQVRAIFNAKNFGYSRSLFYGLSQAEGDCAVMMFADLQDPPGYIPEFVAQWEKGAKIVAGIRVKSEENPIVAFLRRCYYWVIKRISEIDHIEHFDGFGLYDQSFLRVLRSLDDPLPYLRGIVAELGFQRVDVEYTQARRKKGRSHFNIMALYDLAMLGITSYTKSIMHLCTILGGVIAALCALIALGTLVVKLIAWDSYPIGTAATSIGIFLLGGLQLFFVGFVGEYIVNINTRVMHHPLVVEQERLNFGPPAPEKEPAGQATAK